MVTNEHMEKKNIHCLNQETLDMGFRSVFVSHCPRRYFWVGRLLAAGTVLEVVGSFSKKSSDRAVLK